MNSTPTSTPTFPALLYGLLISGIGLLIYFLGVVFRFVGLLVDPYGWSLDAVHAMVWFSGVPVITGLLLILFDLFVLLPKKRSRVDVQWDPPANSQVTVVLTAYNDESSIGLSVQDFQSHPRVRRVIVVDNNSKDATSEVARRAGAQVVLESRPGYGHCVHRALSEGMACLDTELTLLCEGDMTFRAHDVDKFLAYIPHSDFVNGTRIAEQLRELRTQLTTFMFYGNFFVGKLLEAKHLGKGTLTDVGTTYKLCRNSTLARLLPLLNPTINLEFNAYFLDQALTHGFSLVECPITFYSRVGVSKGGNVSNVRAFRVGFRMLSGIIFGWRLKQ